MRYTREKLIQLIHIAKHKLAMDDITYKQMLSQLTGEESCSKLKVAQLMLVYTEMEKKDLSQQAKEKNQIISILPALAVPPFVTISHIKSELFGLICIN